MNQAQRGDIEGLARAAREVSQKGSRVQELQGPKIEGARGRGDERSERRMHTEIGNAVALAMGLRIVGVVVFAYGVVSGMAMIAAGVGIIALGMMIRCLAGIWGAVERGARQKQ